MDLPEFLLRKLYQRGSLHETAPGEFGFVLQNRLGSATVISPPTIVINGIGIAITRVRSPQVDVSAITRAKPFVFAKGQAVMLRLPGSLLRGGNHIQVTVQTKEFGELRIDAEDRCAAFCDVPATPE